MADAWDEYFRRQQEPARPQATMSPNISGSLPSIFGSLFSFRKSSAPQPSGGLTPNKQGLYTPSLMGQMPQPGPATPINYPAIRNLLNSGVLRTGTVAPMPAPAPEPAPAPAPQAPDNPLARLASVFAGIFR
jgi:hypothetical protein